MKIALIGINSRYSHKNLAILSLYSAVRDLAGDPRYGSPEFQLLECSINEPPDHVLRKIMAMKAEILSFSVYVWNKEMVLKLARDIKALDPGVIILAGGPEIHAGYLVEEAFDFLILGEGEGTFRKLLEAGFQGERLQLFSGRYADLDALPFAYEDVLDRLAHRIVYYEGSRGCPFRCSYCLSGEDNRLRLKQPQNILRDMEVLCRHGVKQVKFIDRTFNARPQWALAIIKGLKDLASYGCNFHFEVSLDKMAPEILEEILDSPTGLFQLEIGIQSCNEDTLAAIRRKNDFPAIKRGVQALLEKGNVHLHTDLIAGLPYEGLESFKKGFAAIYDLEAQMLQVGFLKVIPNTALWQDAQRLGIRYRDYPPYEVLATPWMKGAELLVIKEVEEGVEGFYNKGHFRQTLHVLHKAIRDPFNFYRKLGAALLDREDPPSLQEKAAMLLEALDGMAALKILQGLLALDWMLRNKGKAIPSFLGEGLLEEVRIPGQKTTGRVLVLPFALRWQGHDAVIEENRGSRSYLLDYTDVWSPYRYPRLKEWFQV